MNYRFIDRAYVAFTVEAKTEKEAIRKASVAMTRLSEGFRVPNQATVSIGEIEVYTSDPDDSGKKPEIIEKWS